MVLGALMSLIGKAHANLIQLNLTQTKQGLAKGLESQIPCLNLPKHSV